MRSERRCIPDCPTDVAANKRQARKCARIVWLAVNAAHSHASFALPLLHRAAADFPGVTWSAVEATGKDLLADVTAAVIAQDPDVLSASVYLFNRRFVLDVVQRVKALLPACRVLLGGPEFLGDNAPFLRTTPVVDAVLRGEGERGFRAWLAAWLTTASWESVPGLCWLDAAGHYRDNGCAEPVAAAELRSPAQSLFFDWSKPFVQLETSRGCQGACAYCTSARTGPVRQRPWREVVEDLRLYARHGVREVRVIDRTFNADTRRCARLLRQFRRECANMRFHLEIHPAFLPAAVKREIEAAPPGHLHLEVGLQSGSRAALQAVERARRAEPSWAGVEYLGACPNLQVHVDLLAGLPEQTLAGLLADLKRLSALGPAEIQLEILKILPGTPLHETAAMHGIVFAPVPPYDVLRTQHMSVQDLRQARGLSRLVDGYYNRPELRPAVRAAGAELPDFFLRLNVFLEKHGFANHRLGLEKRFRTLYAFLTEAECLGPAEILERAWLRAGLSPEHGLRGAVLWRGPLPAELECLEGALPASFPRRVRTWHLRQRNSEHWYVMPRTAGARAPLAVLARSDSP